MMFFIPFWGVPVREMQISGAIPVRPGFYGFHRGSTGVPPGFHPGSTRVPPGCSGNGLASVGEGLGGIWSRSVIRNRIILP